MYLKFLNNKTCNRSKEISILTKNFDVEKLIFVEFKHFNNENVSIYEIIFKTNKTEEELDLFKREYFEKNKAVKMITQEELEKLKNNDIEKEDEENSQILLKRK